MQVPLSWLKDFVEIKVAPQELAELLARRGIGIESLQLPQVVVSGVKVGKIVALDKHPNADKLQIASVDLGIGNKSIITAATNVKVGDIIPVALDGAKLATGLEIKPTKLRGVLSEGMMCSGNELGLDIKELPQEQKEGIMLLPPDSPLGGDVAELMLLNDPVLYFEIFANRPDLLSVTGIAREVAAALGESFRLPQVHFQEIEPATAGLLALKIEDLSLCPYYRARLISNIKIAPSPLQIAARLRKSGIRSLNNMVDLTNYVMLETGQPLHAFDYDRLVGHTVIVRLARRGETILTIDESKINLEAEDLVIADADKPVALAGVMGGKDTEVSESTTRILLECANFNPLNIRRTAQRLGMRSESSRRFEKGLDRHLVYRASERAAQFFYNFGAAVHSGGVEIKSALPEPKRIILRVNKLNELLGTDIAEEEIKAHLEAGGLKTTGGTGSLEVEIPSYRADLNVEIDLVEEVARAYGYDKIKATMPKGEARGKLSQQEREDELLRTVLTRLGCLETITYALQDERDNPKFKLPEAELKVINPLSQEQGSLRVSLLPNLSKVIAAAAVQSDPVKLFELANLYTINASQELEEERILVLAASGSGFNFYDFKGLIESLLLALGMSYKFVPETLPFLQEGLTAKVYKLRPDDSVFRLPLGATYPGEAKNKEQPIGYCGALAPEIQESLDLPHKVWFAELQLFTRNFNAELQEKSLTKFIFPHPRLYEPLPKYPACERDLAFVLPDTYTCGSLTELILEKGSPLLQKAFCFDIYKGKPIPEGYQNQAFRLTFMAQDRTLTEEEVNLKVKEIIKAVEEKFAAQLRA
jgi:phenylalanyl-tRNA synthetase beta chain